MISTLSGAYEQRICETLLQFFMPPRGLPARPRPRTAQPRLLKAASKSSPQLLKSASFEADGLKWRMINEKAAESLLITASLGGETAALVEAREWERSEALHATVDALGERLAATRAVAERKAEELFLLSEKQGAGEQVDAGLPKLVAHAANLREMLEKVRPPRPPSSASGRASST